MDRPWGRWTRLYMDDQVELRLLEVEPGGYCTLHRHEHQANVFVVLRGVLKVLVKRDVVTVNEHTICAEGTHTLYPGEPPLMVVPGEEHQFRALQDRVVAYELNVATGPNPLDPSDSIQLGPAGKES